MRVEFFAGGVARPKGSARAFTAASGKAHVAPASSKEKGWRAGVANAAVAAMAGRAPLDGPLTIDVVFYMPRPRSHYRTGKNFDQLRETAPVAPTSSPDASKLLRSIEDAMNGIVFTDDARLVTLLVSKRYCHEHQPHVGVKVAVWPWRGEGHQ